MITLPGAEVEWKTRPLVVREVKGLRGHVGTGKRKVLLLR
jgi:hypothetical protein